MFPMQNNKHIFMNYLEDLTKKFGTLRAMAQIAESTFQFV